MRGSEGQHPAPRLRPDSFAKDDFGDGERVGGTATGSLFDRYDIGEEPDLEDAAEKLRARK